MARRDVRTLERYFRWEHLPQRLQPISMLFWAAFARLVTSGEVDILDLKDAMVIEAQRLGVNDAAQLDEAKFDVGTAWSFASAANHAANHGVSTEEALYQAGCALIRAKDAAVRSVLGF